ncbi:hypothetical protein BD769DRAFT_1391401 [Suillus cothurnatus]|nr:hypothetical protein BD769DRAFT_1391401 [Suillus cothurnatus]
MPPMPKLLLPGGRLWQNCQWTQPSFRDASKEFKLAQLNSTTLWPPIAREFTHMLDVLGCGAGLRNAITDEVLGTLSLRGRSQKCTRQIHLKCTPNHGDLEPIHLGASDQSEFNLARGIRKSSYDETNGMADSPSGWLQMNEFELKHWGSPMIQVFNHCYPSCQTQFFKNSACPGKWVEVARACSKEFDLERATLGPAFSLPHAQASMGSGQVMAEATLLLSFPNPQNINLQRCDPPVGTSQMILENPLPVSLADYQVRHSGILLLQSQSSMSDSLRHVISNETPSGSRTFTCNGLVTLCSRKHPQLPPPSFQSPQDLNAQEAGSASLPAGSSYHTTSSKKHRRDSLSLLCHRHGQSSTTPIAHTQEDVRLKLSCQRSINGRSNLKERAMLPLKIIHYKPSGPNDTAQLPITPPQTIVVPTQSLEQVKDESHALMVILIFENGFFPDEATLEKMANDALNTAIDQHSDESKGPEDVEVIRRGHKPCQKVEGGSLNDLLGLSESKEEMDVLCTDMIESMLLEYAFVDAWVKLQVGVNNFQQLCIPFGHVVVISLIKYMMVNQGYYQFISLGTEGWERRLGHTIAVVSTVYHSVLLKLKTSSNRVEVNELDSKYYDDVIKCLYSVSGPERWMLDQLLTGLHIALA